LRSFFRAMSRKAAKKTLVKSTRAEKIEREYHCVMRHLEKERIEAAKVSGAGWWGIRGNCSPARKKRAVPITFFGNPGRKTWLPYELPRDRVAKGPTWLRREYTMLNNYAEHGSSLAKYRFCAITGEWEVIGGSSLWRTVDFRPECTLMHPERRVRGEQNRVPKGGVDFTTA